MHGTGASVSTGSGSKQDEAPGESSFTSNGGDPSRSLQRMYFHDHLAFTADAKSERLRKLWPRSRSVNHHALEWIKYE